MTATEKLAIEAFGVLTSGTTRKRSSEFSDIVSVLANLCTILTSGYFLLDKLRNRNGDKSKYSIEYTNLQELKFFRIAIESTRGKSNPSECKKLVDALLKAVRSAGQEQIDLVIKESESTQ